MKILRVHVSDIFNHPDFEEVVNDYFSESCNPDFGNALPSLDWYLSMENLERRETL